MLDLSRKSITLCAVSDTNLELTLLSLLNCMSRVKFTKAKLLTSKVADPSLKFKPDELEIIRISPLTSVTMYSHFVLRDLVEYIDTDYMLIVQHDGTICNENLWRKEFLNYDYIGAPWPDFLIPPSQRIWPNYNVGNGGFSLRSRRLMKLVQKEFDNLEIRHPEDVAVCRSAHMRNLYDKLGIRIAPTQLAKIFSVENPLDKEHLTNTFGFHGDINRVVVITRPIREKLLNSQKA